MSGKTACFAQAPAVCGPLPESTEANRRTCFQYASYQVILENVSIFAREENTQASIATNFQ